MNTRTFSIKKIPHYLRVVWHRILRPWWWKLFRKKHVRARLAADFPARVQPLFFNSKEHSLQKSLLCALLSDTEIHHQAKEAREHRFAFFSNELRAHGEQIDWQKDYASGARWDSSKAASELDFVQSVNGSDVKYVWDVNRCQWFLWLGMAYVLEKEEHTTKNAKEVLCSENVQAFMRDVESWQAANPLGMGINWAMPMEVAIRATNWIVAASFFYEAHEGTKEFWQGFMRSLWQHGEFLSYNLEFVRNNANHFMSNAMGLVVLGAFFMQQDDTTLKNIGNTWFRCGKRFMEREIMRQFYSDGINYEKSTSYHRFVVEMCTIAFAAAERVREPFEIVYYQQLTQSFSYIFTYSRADSSAPRFGDTDNGRVLRYTPFEDYNNHLKNLDFECIFFGNTLVPKQNKVRSPFSTHFPHGNYVVWRNETTHFMADIGDYGMNGWGGHGHNDCLSFELWAQGESILIDSGTGCYTSNTELRNALRSTKAHNTVMLEKAEQTEYAGLWRIKRDELAPALLEYTASEQGLTLCAEHSGYFSRFGVKHRRTWKLESNAEQGKLCINDEFIPGEQHQRQELKRYSGEVNLILSDECECEQISPSKILCRFQTISCTISNSAGLQMERCPISLFYGDVRQGWRIFAPCSTDTASETVIEWER
ncbi:MAG: hypothetical protein EAZ92_03410 [Candidatus Kapaibacterium sp.]|nr:MAG: hypothetical protein EAZ92_03410 [Candidatus Kapabacteria bacterium]